MIQWDRELPPGTLLLARTIGRLAVVIHVSTTLYVNGWRQLRIKALLNNNTLVDIEMEEVFFQRVWEWHL